MHSECVVLHYNIHCDTLHSGRTIFRFGTHELRNVFCTSFLLWLLGCSMALWCQYLFVLDKGTNAESRVEWTSYQTRRRGLSGLSAATQPNSKTSKEDTQNSASSFAKKRPLLIREEGRDWYWTAYLHESGRVVFIVTRSTLFQKHLKLTKLFHFPSHIYIF